MGDWRGCFLKALRPVPSPKAVTVQSCRIPLPVTFGSHCITAPSNHRILRIHTAQHNTPRRIASYQSYPAHNSGRSLQPQPQPNPTQPTSCHFSDLDCNKAISYLLGIAIMARQQWVAQIRNARSPAEQTAILRALKNEVIGHPLKKETIVAQGILDPIVRLSFNTKSSRNDGKSHDHSFAARPLSEEETVRLQGLHVISSIALGEEELHCTEDLSTANSTCC